MPEESLDSVIVLARAISQESEHADTLVSIAGHTKSSSRVEQLLREALNAIRMIRDSDVATSARARLAGYLPPEFLESILASVRHMPPGELKAMALVDLAPALPPAIHAGGVRETLLTEGEMWLQSGRIENLCRLARTLPGIPVDAVLTTIKQGVDTSAGRRALVEIAACLDSAGLRQALDAASVITDRAQRVQLW